MNLEGNCDRLVVVDMWRTHLAGIEEQFRVGFNRKWLVNSKFFVAIGVGASSAKRLVEVEGRFGRVHLSPRFDIGWSAVEPFSAGPSTAIAFRSWLVGGPYPGPFPWVILQQKLWPLSFAWFPISQAFNPLEIPLTSAPSGYPSPC